MSEIKIEVKDKVALCRKRYLISSNENYTVNFEFDEEWKEHEAKTARFMFDFQYVDVAFIGNSVAVPRVIPCETLSIGVFSDSVASTAARVGCVLSVRDQPGTEVSTIDNDQYAALLELINSLDLRQVKIIERDENEVKIYYTDGSSSSFPVYDGVSVSACSVSQDGELIVTLSNGTELNAGSVRGKDGKDGEKGETGSTGATPILSIGTVETVASSADAGATLGGTAEEPVLNLSLPRGESVSGTEWKKIYGETMTEQRRFFFFEKFADGTPIKCNEIFIRGAVLTDSGADEQLKVFYGWPADGVSGQYLTLCQITGFCKKDGTDISSGEMSVKSELIGKRIYNRYNYAVFGGVIKEECLNSTVETFNRVGFFPGGGEYCEPGSWIEVYGR